MFFLSHYLINCFHIYLFFTVILSLHFHPCFFCLFSTFSSLFRFADSYLHFQALFISTSVHYHFSLFSSLLFCYLFSDPSIFLSDLLSFLHMYFSVYWTLSTINILCPSLDWQFSYLCSPFLSQYSFFLSSFPFLPSVIFIFPFWVLSHFHVYPFLYFQHISCMSNYSYVHSFSLSDLYTTLYFYIFLSAHFSHLYFYKTIHFNITILVDNIYSLKYSIYFIIWLTVFTFNLYYFSSFPFLLLFFRFSESCLHFSLYLFSHLFILISAFLLFIFSHFPLWLFFFSICIFQYLPSILDLIHNLPDTF